MKKILLLLYILIVAFITVPMAGATTMFTNSATFGPDILHELNVTGATGTLVQDRTVSTGNGRGVME